MELSNIPQCAETELQIRPRTLFSLTKTGLRTTRVDDLGKTASYFEYKRLTMNFLELRCCLAMVVTLLTTTQAFAQSESVGVSFLRISPSGESRPLDLTLWYPTDTIDRVETIGGNAVFLGAAAVVDASPLLGKKALLIISHGGLRSAANSGAWFAQRMAEKGFLALEVNAPRLTSAEHAPNEIWLRPADMSRALDTLIAHPEWSRLIDKSRIVSVGFFLGGTASLLLSDLVLSVAALRSSCYGEIRSEDCEWLSDNGVDLSTNFLKTTIRANLTDTRMLMNIAVAPEYLHAFAKTLAKERQTGLAMLYLSEQPSVSAQRPIGAYIGNANRFDGFGLCKRRGAAIIAEEGGDPRLCGGALLPRMNVHDEIVERVLTLIRE